MVVETESEGEGDGEELRLRGGEWYGSLALVTSGSACSRLIRNVSWTQQRSSREPARSGPAWIPVAASQRSSEFSIHLEAKAANAVRGKKLRFGSKKDSPRGGQGVWCIGSKRREHVEHLRELRRLKAAGGSICIPKLVRRQARKLEDEGVWEHGKCTRQRRAEKGNCAIAPRVYTTTPRHFLYEGKVPGHFFLFSPWLSVTFTPHHTRIPVTEPGLSTDPLPTPSNPQTSPPPLVPAPRKLRLVDLSRSRAHAEQETRQYHSTIEAMVGSDYPVLSCFADVHQKPEGWIESPQVAAMQMVLTRSMRDALTWFTLSTSTRETLCDQLVEPPSPITDYLTRTVLPSYFLPLLGSRANDLSGLGLGYGKFRTDYDPIMVNGDRRSRQPRRPARHDDDCPRHDRRLLLCGSSYSNPHIVGGDRLVIEITPKVGADSLPGSDNTNPNLTGAAETKTRNTGFPTIRRRQQHPVRNRDEPERTPDSVIRIAPTAHCATHLLDAQRPVLDLLARCTPGGVSTLPESASLEPEKLWDGYGNWSTARWSRFDDECKLGFERWPLRPRRTIGRSRRRSPEREWGYCSLGSSCRRLRWFTLAMSMLEGTTNEHYSTPPWTHTPRAIIFKYRFFLLICLIGGRN
ncbi:hypothetical protein EDB89DRAFT_1902088 [Lactarius sanguifluus]|nr:hypothetical protein EDB89DRAFT_1902088 [Lactarius sanguifluus]